MCGCVRVKTNQVGTGICKGGSQCIDRLHHEVHIDGHIFAIGSFSMRLEGLTNHGAEGQVGHVMVVHHVEVNPVCAGGNDIANFFAQTGKVGRQK